MANKNSLTVRDYYRKNRPLSMFDVFGPFSLFRPEIDRFNYPSIFDSNHFNSLMSSFDSEISVNMKETETSYIVEASLAGYSKDDINIELSKGILTISAEKKEDTENKEDDNSYIIKEIHHSYVSRSLSLKDADENKVSAKFDNGILNIEIGKKEKKVESVNIKID